jgi:hypothetical protein
MHVRVLALLDSAMPECREDEIHSSQHGSLPSRPSALSAQPSPTSPHRLSASSGTRACDGATRAFEHDRRAQLVVDARGDYAPANVKRRELNLPDVPAVRNGAAMDCDDAEEARDLPRHKKHKRHPGGLPRPLRGSAARMLRARDGSAAEALDGERAQPQEPPRSAEIVDLQAQREAS